MPPFTPLRRNTGDQDNFFPLIRLAQLASIDRVTIADSSLSSIKGRGKSLRSRRGLGLVRVFLTLRWPGAGRLGGTYPAAFSPRPSAEKIASRATIEEMNNVLRGQMPEVAVVSTSVPHHVRIALRMRASAFRS